jgi:hypothetical protein
MQVLIFNALYMRKIVLLYLLSVGLLQGQTIYPVQVTPQLLPPYSLYLADYVQAGSERFRLIVLQRDLNVPTYQIRFRLRIFRNGSEAIRLKSNFVPAPITVEPGVPVLVSGSDLSPYLNYQNWEFVGGGINEDLYTETKALPEGNYQFCFTAYDYQRPEVAVSGVGCTFAFLSKGEPPLLNLPFCGTEIFGQNSPQILFQWYPRHLSSPNAAEDTEYKFELFEVRPAGRSINDVVLSSPPIYQTTTDFTQLLYGLAEPPLLDSMQYVWRVQAIDKTGRDAFRNQGYSQVCDFHYKLTGTAPPPPVVVGTPTDLTADALNKQTIKFEWGKVATDSFTVYSLEYRKVGVDSSSNPHSWFLREVTELTYTARDVEPATRYEARVRGKLGDTWGAYSAPVEVTTPADIPMQCGDDQQFPQADPNKPLGALLPQMTLVVRGMDVVVSEVTSGSNGQFTGRGKVITPYLGASFRVKFEDLYIDERLVVGAGKVEFLTQGMTNFINGQLANQEMRQLHRLQQANRLRFADLSFYGTIFTYQVSITNIWLNGSDTTYIAGQQGLIANVAIVSLMLDNPGKAFIVQDKNGDQWVIKPDGTVEKAEGGGLPPVQTLSSADRNLLKEVLLQIRNENNQTIVAEAKNNFENKKQALSTLIESFYASVTLSNSPTPTNTSVETNLEISPFIDVPTTGNPTLDTIYNDYVITEKNSFIRIVLHGLAAETIAEKNVDFLGAFLIVNNMSYAEYVAQKRDEGVGETVIIPVIKQSIVQLVTETIELIYEDEE